MALITAADVKAVYATERGDDELKPFIAIAETYSTDLLAGKLSDPMLKLVQQYLAAHFLYVSDAGIHASLRVEDVQERFTKSEKHPGLLDSRYGAMAVSFDTSGTLAAAARPQQTAELRLFTGC